MIQSVFLSEYQADLIDKGLKDCMNLRDRGLIGNADFYDGAIEAFGLMKWLNLDEIEARWIEAQKFESDLYINMGINPTEAELATYWRQRGKTMQFKFIYQRVFAMQILLQEREE